MDSIQRALQSIGRMWSALHATQRVILSASAVLMVVLLVWGSAASAPSWVRVAGPEVTGDARANILRKLQEKNQKHEVRGAEIYVPKDDADRVVLELAGDGAMSDDAIYKFLETSDIFMSPKDKELRYKRALEQKLGMMIRRVDFVRNASVLITPGSNTDRLGFEGQRASASVQVELQEGRVLTPKNTVAIANLVAKSVPGLDTDQVVITDTKGNSYALPKQEGGTALAQFFRDYEKSIEEDIQGRIKQAFRTAIVMVRVETRKTTITKKTVKNTNPRAEQDDERVRTEKAAAGSAAKVIKGGDELTPAAAEPAPRETTDREIRTRNRFDVDDTEVKDPAGQIEGINIGVLIPIETGPDNKELLEAEKQLGKIREWVTQAAAGKGKSDSISVQFIAMKKPEAVIAPPAPETMVEWASKHATKVALFGLSLAALYVLLRVVQAAMARDTVEEIQSLTDALTETQQAATELAGGTSPAAGDLGRLKQNVQDMVGRNPQSVAASLKSFMSGK